MPTPPPTMTETHSNGGIYIPKNRVALQNMYCCFVRKCGFNLHKQHCAVNFIVLHLFHSTLCFQDLFLLLCGHLVLCFLLLSDIPW